MKKSFYIFCFMVLGFLLQFWVHAVIEMYVLDRVSWDQWHPFWHTIVGGTLLVLGLGFGLHQGFHWWDQIYVKKRFGKIK